MPNAYLSKRTLNNRLTHTRLTAYLSKHTLNTRLPHTRLTADITNLRGVMVR